MSQVFDLDDGRSCMWRIHAYYIRKHVCGTLKCENAAICEKVAKCEKQINAKYENWRYMWKNNAKCEKMRLSKCVKHFDSKCVKIDAICANFILTLFVKIKF